MAYLLKNKSLMKKALYLTASACFCLTLMACQSTDELAEKKDKVALQMCPEIRPQMCTMEYMPVCGNKADESTKTYGNACSACGDNEVTGYAVGACEVE